MNILYRPANAWMQHGLQLAAYALKPGGRFYVQGAKDRGILRAVPGGGATGEEQTGGAVIGRAAAWLEIVGATGNLDAWP